MAAPAPDPSVCAAVDVGSTSVHLLVARVDGHRVEPLADESVLLGLGPRIDAAGQLGAEARAELVAALQADAERARALGAASITFVGTEPLRRAADADLAAAEVERACAIVLSVVTHEEEALLTLIGVTAGEPIREPLAVVDIGGGSTEVVVAHPGGPIDTRGLAIGAARLAAEILHADPPSFEEIAALRAAARLRIADVPAPATGILVAVGGTPSNLVKILSSPSPDWLTRRLLDEAMATLASEPSVAIAARHGLRETRARILPAGAALLEAILDRCEVDEIRVSEAGIREGTVLVTAHAGIAWRDRLPVLALGWET